MLTNVPMLTNDWATEQAALSLDVAKAGMSPTAADTTPPDTHSDARVPFAACRLGRYLHSTNLGFQE
jgi:hypothetical protein